MAGHGEKAVERVLRTIVIFGVYAGLTMQVAYFPMLVFPFIASKIFFFQIVIGLTVPAYIGLALLNSSYRPSMSLVSISVIACTFSILLSSLFAADPFRSFWGGQERLNGCFTMLHFVAFFFMAGAVLRTPGQRRALSVFQVLLGIFVAVEAFFELIPFLPRHDTRAAGLLGNPIYFGHYELLIMFAFGYLFVTAEKKRWRLLCLLGLAVCLLAIAASGSRGPLFGLIAGSIFSAGLVYAFHADNVIRRRVAIGIGLVCVFYIFMAVVVVRLPFLHDFWMKHSSTGRIFSIVPSEIWKDSSFSAYARLVAWKAAWQGFLDRPIFGWGLENYFAAFNTHYEPGILRLGIDQTWFDRAHNQFLDMLAMQGIIGFGAYCMQWVAAVLALVRMYRSSVISRAALAVAAGAIAGHLSQSFFVFDHPASLSVVFGFLAMIDSCEPRIIKHERLKTTHRLFRRRTLTQLSLVAVIQLGGALLVYFGTFRGARCSNLVMNAYQLRSEGRLGEMVAYSRRILGFETPYSDIKVVFFATTAFDMAVSGRASSWPDWGLIWQMTSQTCEQYLGRHPLNVQMRIQCVSLYHIAARIIGDKSLFDIAESHIKEAIRQSPLRQESHMRYAQLLAETGRAAEAVNEANRITSVDETLGYAWWMSADVFDNFLHLEHASRQRYRKALEARYPYGLSRTENSRIR
ncbi:MAG: O-antigen ligase family protein [Oligoflexales bacterium]|nr:O-antigen ligase family protein [Oligoflexales bacterium]